MVKRFVHRDLAAIAAVTVLLSTMAVTAGFAEPTNPTDRIECVGGSGQALSADKLTSAEIEDAEAYARQEKVSVNDSVSGYLWAKEFGSIAEEIGGLFASDFSGVSITPSGPCQAWIGFRREIPQLALEAISNASRPVHVVIDLGYIESDLVDKQNRVTAALKGVPGASDFSSSYDLVRGTVSIGARPAAAGKGTALNDALHAALPAEYRSDPSVTITVVDEASLVRTGDIYGGGIFELDGTENLECTAGFAVKKGTTRGMSTAGHCANNLRFANQPGHGEWATVYKAGHEGQWGDFQWSTTNAYESDNFYYSYSSTGRDATGVSSLPAIGSPVCRFGWSSGQQCGTVRRTNVTAGGIGRLVQMTTSVSTGGDSGGPAYNGSVAVGLIIGQTRVPGESNFYDSFSLAVYLPEAIPGVSVATE